MDSSRHLIDAHCRIVDSNWAFRFTGVHGTPYHAKKTAFWQQMNNDFYPTTIPWICGGDFNDFLCDWEKSGEVVIRHNWERYLGDFMNNMELLDLEFHGPKFTRRGHRNGHLVEARLDRDLVNQKWLEMWPNTYVSHATVLGSDHNPLIVQGEPQCSKGKRLFRFEAYWSNEVDCQDIVRSCWEMPCLGDSLSRWNKRVNDCRSKLIAGGNKLRQNWNIMGNCKRIGT